MPSGDIDPRIRRARDLVEALRATLDELALPPGSKSVRRMIRAQVIAEHNRRLAREQAGEKPPRRAPSLWQLTGGVTYNDIARATQVSAYRIGHFFNGSRPLDFQSGLLVAKFLNVTPERLLEFFEGRRRRQDPRAYAPRPAVRPWNATTAPQEQSASDSLRAESA
jgi:hypothetical protein